MAGLGEIVGIVSAVSALVELSGKIIRQGYSFTRTAIKAPIQIRQLLSEVSSLDTLLNEVNDLASDTTKPFNNVNTNLRDAQDARYPGTCQWLLDSPDYTSWRDERHGQILWINGPPGSGKTVMSATVVQNLRECFQGSSAAVLYFYLEHRDSSKQTLAAILSQAIRQLVQLRPESAKLIKSLKDTNHNGVEKATPSTKLQMDLLRDLSKSLFDNVFLVIDALDESVSPQEVIKITECLAYVTKVTEPNQAPPTAKVLCTSRRLPYIEQKFDRIGCIDVKINANAYSEVQQDIRSYVEGQLDEIFSEASDPFSRDHSTITDLKQQAADIVTAKSGGLFLQAKYHLNLLSDTPSIKRFRATLHSLPNGLRDTYNLILGQIRQRHWKYMTEILRMLHWLAGVREPTTVDVLAHVAVIEPDDTSFDPDTVGLDTNKLLLMLSSLITVDYDRGSPLVRFSHFTVREHLMSLDILASSEKDFYIDMRTINKELAMITLQYLSFDQFAEPDPVYASDYKIRLRFDMYTNTLARFTRMRVQDRSRCRWRTKRLRKRRKADFLTKLDDYPLLAYASEFWYDHVNASDMTAQELLGLNPNITAWLFSLDGSDPRFANWIEVHSSGCMRSDDCEFKQPPLYFALLFGVLPWVQALATDDSLPDTVWTTPFEGGWSSMTLAAASQSTAVVDEVLNHTGLNEIDTPAAKNKKRKTALHIAAELGDERMIQHLLSKGASPWVLTTSGTTPLYRVAGSGSMHGLRLIYESVEPARRNEYVNMPTWDDWTALMNAVFQNKLEAVEFLLDHGADWSIKTLQGLTPLSLSIRNEHFEIRDVLMRRINQSSGATAHDSENSSGLRLPGPDDHQARTNETPSPGLTTGDESGAQNQKYGTTIGTIQILNFGDTED